MTVNFRKLEIQLVKVDTSNAKVDRLIFAKIARHLPTRHRGLVRHCVFRRWLRWKVEGWPPPRGRPETFHRSRGAKLQEESSQLTAVVASQKHRRRASESEPTSSAAKNPCNIATSTVNFHKFELQLSEVDSELPKVGNPTWKVDNRLVKVGNSTC